MLLPEEGICLSDRCSTDAAKITRLDQRSDGAGQDPAHVAFHPGSFRRRKQRCLGRQHAKDKNKDGTERLASWLLAARKLA